MRPEGPKKSFLVNLEINFKKTVCIMSIIEHFSDFLGETEHFSGKNGALIRWSILVGKQKHNVQKPISGLDDRP